MSFSANIADTANIVWYGRGGQGAKMASMMLADIMFKAGFYAQAFPEYGAERQGAPVKAYTRISRNPIRTRCSIQRPNVVVVMDPTMLANIKSSEVDRDAIFLVNSPVDPSLIREKLKLMSAMHVIAADATGIAMRNTGYNKPNTAMLGMLTHVFETVQIDIFCDVIKENFKNTSVANIQAFNDGWEFVVWG